MSNKQVYVSYVIKNKENHSHYSEIITIPPTQIAIYSDNTSQKVVEWANVKQGQLNANEKVVILNYFLISNFQ